MEFKRFLEIVKKEKFYPQGGESKLTYAIVPHMSLLSMKEMYGINFPLAISYIKDNYMTIFWTREGMKNVANFFIAEQKKNPRFIETIESRSKKTYDALRSFVDGMPHLENLNLKHLIALYEKLIERGFNFWNNLIFIDAFDTEGTQLLERELQNTQHIEKIDMLTYPSELSYVQHERLDFLKIAQKIIETEKKESFIKTERVNEVEKNIFTLIRHHHQSYYWYKNNYATILSLGLDFFYEELKKFLLKTSHNSIHKQITKIEEDFRGRLGHRNKLLVTLPPEKRSIAGFFIKMTTLRDKRKGGQLLLITNIKQLLIQIADRSGVRLELLENIAYWEITRIKEVVKELEERKNGVATITYDSHGMFFYTGNEGRMLKEMLEREIMKDFSELQGMPASKGKATGAVKIINKADEFKRFKRGDILVSAMTRPDFAQIMEKAAAIVTDEGGITCHAAIVSRELGIPCVVGTEVATRVLKDGDIVEVNANEGIVKKIK